MYPKILTRMRESVRQNKLIFSIHGVEEMDADNLLKRMSKTASCVVRLLLANGTTTFKSGSI